MLLRYLLLGIKSTNVHREFAVTVATGLEQVVKGSQNWCGRFRDSEVSQSKYLTV